MLNNTIQTFFILFIYIFLKLILTDQYTSHSLVEVALVLQGSGNVFVARILQRLSLLCCPEALFSCDVALSSSWVALGGLPISFLVCPSVGVRRPSQLQLPSSPQLLDQVFSPLQLCCRCYVSFVVFSCLLVRVTSDIGEFFDFSKRHVFFCLSLVIEWPLVCGRLYKLFPSLFLPSGKKKKKKKPKSLFCFALCLLHCFGYFRVLWIWFSCCTCNL